MKFNVHKFRRDDDGTYTETHTEKKEALAVYGCIAVYKKDGGECVVFHLPSEIAIHTYQFSDAEEKARRMAEFVSELDGIENLKPSNSFRASLLNEPDDPAIREKIRAYLRDNFF
jgi:hypothetical protein